VVIKSVFTTAATPPTKSPSGCCPPYSKLKTHFCIFEIKEPARQPPMLTAKQEDILLGYSLYSTTLYGGGNLFSSCAWDRKCEPLHRSENSLCLAVALNWESWLAGDEMRSGPSDSMCRMLKQVSAKDWSTHSNRGAVLE
jgi:hypothetical protein